MPSDRRAHARHASRTTQRRWPLPLVALASAVLPGSGHLAVGRRRTGLVVLAVALLLAAVVAAVGIVALIDIGRLRPVAADCALSPGCLTAVQGGAIALGLAWAAVIVTAVLAGRPRSRGIGERTVAGAVTVALCAGAAVPVALVTDNVQTTRQAVGDLFGDDDGDQSQAAGRGGGEAPSTLGDGRINVLLVGSDAAEDRTGTRTDTVIVASIDVPSGRTILFSLPRNLQQVPFPPGSEMAQQWPDGFDCGNACLLNAVYGWAEGHPAYFPGDPHPGMTALRDGVSATLGLDLDYDVMVDMQGFEEIIDALGGVTIRVDRRLPIGGIDAFGNQIPPRGYIEPGLQRMDGDTALAYARSRSDSTDYDRIDRQRCLLGGVARSADPAGILLNYADVLRAITAAIETDIDRGAAREFVDLAFRVADTRIESLPFTPPVVPDTADPDFDEIRDLVREAVARSDAGPPVPTPSPRRSPSPTPTPTDGDLATSPTPAPTGDDLVTSPAPTPSEPVDISEVCSYS